MLYSVVLASATQHSESAAYTHPPLSLPPSPIPPLQVLTEHRVVLLCYTAASHYLSINIYIWSHIYRRRQWHPTPVLLPGKSHGWRSLVGCSHEVAKSDMTERLHFAFSLSCIGEGNGNPLQCSCLENPRDGGAWWAAVYGVAQSRT